MSNARRPPAGRSAASRKAAGPSRLPLILAVVAGVVVLLIVAVVATVGGDDGDDAAGFEQTRPVTISGESLPELGDGESDPALGQAAPVVEGESFDGTPITVGDGPAVLMFLAHWCPHCQREVPVIVDHLQEAPLPEGVSLVAVATSTTESRPNYPPSEWLEREGLDVPTLVDDDRYSTAAAYGLSAFPYFVALNADGEVVMRASGELSPSQFDELVAATGAR